MGQLARQLNWELMIIPILVFLAIYVIGLWLRILIFRILNANPGWQPLEGP